MKGVRTADGSPLVTGLSRLLPWHDYHWWRRMEVEHLWGGARSCKFGYWQLGCKFLEGWEKGGGGGGDPLEPDRQVAHEKINLKTVLGLVFVLDGVTQKAVFGYSVGSLGWQGFFCLEVPVTYLIIIFLLPHACRIHFQFFSVITSRYCRLMPWLLNPWALQFPCWVD